MISTFNIEKLNKLLKDFYTLSHIRITVFDENFKELTSYPSEIALICQIIRSDKCAREECHKCDVEACRKANGRKTPYIYQCHAGLTEAIAPLYFGNIVVGYLLFGHIISYESGEEAWKEIYGHCKRYDIDKDKLYQCCLEQRTIEEDYIDSSASILQAVASYLCLERMVILKRKGLAVQVDEYISRHYLEDLDVETLCQHFNIGKTTLYKLAKENYGIGITDHIRNLKIEKAKKLLSEDSEMRVSEISIKCGFSDYNYFITLFKKKVGMPPQKYRLIHLDNNIGKNNE